VKHFYVSAIDGSRRYLIAGPYPTIIHALEKVETVLEIADRRDPRAWFMAWGTAGSDVEFKTPLGRV
jgi:hypothetical protein